MKTLRSLLSLLGFGAAATFAIAGAQSAGHKSDCCARDSACCTGGDKKCCATDESCCVKDAACCKDAAACCAKEAGCCEDEAGQPEPKDSKAAVGATAATADAAAIGLVKAYVPVADALAADNLDQAQHAAADLARAAKAGNQKAIYDSALGVVHSSDLKNAREAFKKLSSVVAPIAATSKDYVVMTCPMAKADWVQTDTNVRNPYYGSSMLTCGMPKKS